MREGAVDRVSGVDGSKLESIKTKKFASTYGSAMSWDYRYFGGGAWPRDGMVIYDRKTGELYEPETSPNSGPARGEFDPAGNYWAAGRGGQLVKFDIKEKRAHEYPLPTPYTSLYTAKADKNGEVWAGELNGGHYLRFDPKTEQFTDYDLPTKYSGPYRAQIDKHGDIWTGGMQTDRVSRLDPKSGQWVEYLMPTDTNMRTVFVDDSGAKPVFWTGSNHAHSLVKVEMLD